MKLIVTIDTEEDNWGNYNPTGHTLNNIEKIPSLQELFNEYNVHPTYLITYPVATDERSISILKAILNDGKCEIGMHCHPWNTPPFIEKISNINSMLCNLPTELQYKKLSTLHKTIQSNFNITPVSFRAGRWGFNQEVARNIYKLGYKIDTSVTPFIDWSMYHGPNYSTMPLQAYKFSTDDITKESTAGQLFEIPATIGFSQKYFTLANRIYNASKIFRANGILYRLNIINKIWFSPELSKSAEMIKLSKRLMRKSISYINMTFHSPSLQHGLTPFVKNLRQENEFIQKLRECFTFLNNMDVESITLSDALTVERNSSSEL